MVLSVSTQVIVFVFAIQNDNYLLLLSFVIT